MTPGHFHKCPDCNKAKPCDMDCTTYPEQNGERYGGVIACEVCSIERKERLEYAENLIRHSIELLRVGPRKWMRREKIRPLWQRIGIVYGFGLDETTAREICTRYGFNPDEIVTP